MAVLLSPHRRSIRARIGAHSLHAQRDSRELTAPARRAATDKLNQRLLAEIDPHNNELSDKERARRLDHARKAHFSRLALARGKGRRSRSE